MRPVPGHPLSPTGLSLIAWSPSPSVLETFSSNSVAGTGASLGAPGASEGVGAAFSGGAEVAAQQFLIRGPAYAHPLANTRPMPHRRRISLVGQRPGLPQPPLQEEPACLSSPPTVHLPHVQISALDSSEIHLLSLFRALALTQHPHRHHHHPALRILPTHIASQCLIWG